MAEYLVLGWPEGRLDAARQAQAFRGRLQAQGWRPALEQDGLQAWVPARRPPQVRWDAAARRLLIGRRLETAARKAAAVATAPSEVVADATAFCRDGWGRYVAVWRDAQGGLWALRDPSGSLDALTWRRGELRVLAASFAGIPPPLRPADLAIDWRGLAQQLTEPDALTLANALRGVRGLIPGELHRLGEARAIPVWRPADFIAAEGDDAAAAAARLRAAVVEAVSGLASGYQRLLTELSGGLDSSIVNGVLAQAGLGPRIAAAVHYVGDRREADERRWAQAAADHWDLPLVVADRAIDSVDPERDFADLARDVRPPVGALDAWRDRDMASRMAAHEAEAIITGIGGDAALFQMPTAKIVGDLWTDRGLGAWRAPIAWQTARWLRRSIWSVMAEGVRSARAAPEAAVHPWLGEAGDAPPAKRLQIRALAGVQRAYGRCRRTAQGDLVHPLIAQPVMEACLAIPTWRLVAGGRDRGLARLAFADVLPPSVATRASKGGLTSLFSRRVAASLEVLRPYLLDGVLADAGLLDRAAIEQALQPEQLIWRADGVWLVIVAAIEAWARYWQTQVADAPDARRPQRGA